ncbi:AraC family transcriptional regulator of adaptative response / methylphosphotriester-DNA alkyltransferase methyltransferase [Brevibacillus aydinogluensis]|jgi:AraC family transcriptional regulator, regulatory protein of adaptative response / methylphosphotriester-DNA alkyltransferase methyltransferase|uniref:bifunctional transcriptional activator/DNA repair enzyme AdaA n=1 Tax=Brevibacillus TaxID=55080 RepID=UPI000E36F98C|nr:MULTISPECIES: bifunctional transcriptional activator/DNA repair enzyme AdaA [Brevibacillus]MBR8661055.1 methylphosphotriester-DNA--protein-cysteine methyltransferase family protein [Brevibacillus sp. NL20B1]MDT3415145.1 AraC family transcriptional regulator of adaptative response / methylphosphotriester-DNA alkyltransferase methyltransferase [Brevibacillus aydinogluensis]REK68130.1 MAG: AraC family transcriptional regulator [Brevibacillus sp.]
MKIQRETMWEAVVQCNAMYDGCFYYAVKTTGIFCRPSCKSKTPKQENVEFFFHIAEALQKGYRPCKRCRPDLAQSTYDPNHEVIQEVQHILENEYDKPWTLQTLSKRIGMSSYHLQRLFKKQTGISPKQYLYHIRIEQAKRLLLQGEKNNTEICFLVGFNDTAHFYHVFRKLTGFSPLAFKHQHS